MLAISRYDKRGAISLQDSVKGQHILPFFPNFVALASRAEELLGTTAGAAAASSPSGRPSVPFPSMTPRIATWRPS